MKGVQSVTALPQWSDVDLLCDGERIINLDPEVPDRALHFGVPKEHLDRAKVPRSPVNQRGLGSPQRVGAEQCRVQTDASDPPRQQAGILAGGETAAFAAAALMVEAATMDSDFGPVSAPGSASWSRTASR